jgi:putative ABC transport system permease protein
MMVIPSLKKIWMDLCGNKLRTFLVTLSIAVGIFAVGVIISTFSIVNTDMNADYQSVNPHTALIFSEEFDDRLLMELSQIPGVDAVEGRHNLWIKAVGIDSRQYSININSIGPLSEIKVDQLTYEPGLKALEDNEIYLERQGCAGLGLKAGDKVEMVLADGRSIDLKIAGTVHDVNANPFKFTSKTSGYVNAVTMERLGGSRQYNFVALVTSGSHTDRAHILRIAEIAADHIRQTGREVFNVNVTNPGQHPAQSIIDTVLMLMGLLGVIAVFLSGFLVTNTVSAIMSQQVRIIGVMKAVGATVGQMMLMYMGLVIAFGLLALMAAIPMAGLAAYGLSRWLIEMLNATPSPFIIPLLSIGMQVLVGLVVPLIGGIIPVLGGVRMTVRQAITNYGLSTPGQHSPFDRLLQTLPGLPRPLLLSLRNAFRRKTRLTLTLATLVLGGAVFMGVLSVRTSLHTEVEQSLGYYQSDINVDFPVSYASSRLDEVTQNIPGIVSVEYWWAGKVNIVHAADDSSDQVVLYAPPANSQMITPIVTEGRWLLSDDDNAIVVDNHFREFRPDVNVGDTITIYMNKQNYEFEVVGIIRVAGNATIGTIFMNNQALVTRSSSPEMINNMHIQTEAHDSASQNEVLLSLQSSFVENGIQANLQTGSDMIQQLFFQMDLLIHLLLFMAVLIASVGGIGLMGTMGMNVMERTREIGVMRSIGAENGRIFQLVVIEGMLIGSISWVFALLAAFPITYLLGNLLGKSLLKVPLVFLFSPQGLVIWLVVVLIISAAASFIPARNAVRLTVRDILAYE